MYDSMKADINNVRLSNNHSCGSFYDHTVYRINVVDVIRSLCAGKSDEVDDICSEAPNDAPQMCRYPRSTIPGPAIYTENPDSHLTQT